MKDIKEIARLCGIEFDEMGISMTPIALSNLEKFFEMVINENNSQWSKNTFETINAPFAEMQNKLNELYQNKKV